MTRAVFLDRDGVIVRSIVRDGKPYAPRSMAEFDLYPDAHDALRRLKSDGFTLVLVTNQPDVGNGLTERSVVDSMHAQLGEQMPLDAIKCCFHAQDAGCACRKPRPGMLLEAAGELGAELDKSYMIGDRWLDIVAGRDAGCYTILIDRGYDEGRSSDPDATSRSLSEAVEVVMRQEEDRRGGSDRP